MPRCKKKRFCRKLDGKRIFKPCGFPRENIENVEVSLDEFEAIRLCDYEDKSQIEAGEAMNISRGTIQRLLQSGRKKILDAFLHNKMIIIKNE